MAHPGFGHLWQILWQQPELSDIDIVIGIETKDAAPASESSWPHVVNKEARYSVLQHFPGHKSIISLSPYCKAQVLRWQSQETPFSSSTAVNTHAARQQVRLTLPDASYEAAAVALLQVLYWVKPVSEIVAELTQEQQVQASLLADMWQVPAAGSTAVNLLTQAANSAEGLSQAAFEQMLGMQALPGCLLALCQHALLSKYGDLESAWADAELRGFLLALPVFAMELLLSSDKLKVASEDTVLATAQAYVNARVKQTSDPSARQMLSAQLAPLVRCPHLSHFWLSASVLSEDAPNMLLGGLQLQLKALLLAQQPGDNLSMKEIKGIVPDAPASWLLHARLNRPVPQVQMQWSVDVAEIKDAVRQACSDKGSSTLWSPISAPFEGTCWGMLLRCAWDATMNGCLVDMFATAKTMPTGTICRRSYRIGLDAIGALAAGNGRFQPGFHGSRGRLDCFKLGPMSGGWDEVAWAAKGLPVSGQLKFTLTITK